MALSFSSNSLIYNSKVRYNQKDCVKLEFFSFHIFCYFLQHLFEFRIIIQISIFHHLQKFWRRNPKSLFHLACLHLQTGNLRKYCHCKNIPYQMGLIRRMIRSKKISRLAGTERPSSSLSSRTAPWAVVSPDCIRPVVNPQIPGRIGHCKLLF